MADIGYCYGSEWQLLRFLGHHRDHFFGKIAEKIKVNPSDIRWLDYPSKPSAKSGDGEYVSIDFLDRIPFVDEGKRREIEADWEKTCPKNQNWDGVFYAESFQALYLVEAKAHLDEIRLDCKASGDSMKEIENSLKTLRSKIAYPDSNPDWTKKYYQMANRLSFVDFLSGHGIKAKLVYIYFIDGWKKDSPDNVTSEDVWRQALDKEDEFFRLVDKDRYISEVFIDCAPLKG